MIKEIEIEILPEQINNNQVIEKRISQISGYPKEKINTYKIIKRSIDARKQKVKYRLRIEIYTHESHIKDENDKFNYKYVKNSKPIIIIGSGPAGLFAALKLLELNIKPIIIERGKQVEDRKYDIAILNREQKVNTDSNYCFGEGGAGTYSDGKLYTRSTKRGNVKDVIQQLINHGASTEISFESHPHIGTDKLPSIIRNIRNTIIEHGGEFYFNTKINDLTTKNNQILKVISEKGISFEAAAYVLATGHSAREIFELLKQKNIYIEAKPFALGVRVEHPQELIDSIQYHSKNKNSFLPAATYQLVTQVENRGVFSFCMCPGGIIVPAATKDEQIVVNGMSNSRRNSPYANSGIVVSIELEDLIDYKKYNSLAGLKYQEEIENNFFKYASNGQITPAQKLTDFVNNKLSGKLNPTSYIPGIISAPIHKILPINIVKKLQQAFIQFDNKMRGFLTESANILAVESRTSSPVKIPRDPEKYTHLQIGNLYPCGEGAGYAGGIISSALDGIAVAEKIGILLK